MGGSAYGAVPPPGSEWQIGKTAEEIDAVNKEAAATGKTPAEVATAKGIHGSAPVAATPEATPAATAEKVHLT